MAEAAAEVRSMHYSPVEQVAEAAAVLAIFRHVAAAEEVVSSLRRDL